MIRLLSRAAMSLALFLPLLASGAEAGVGDRAGEAFCAWKRWPPIEKVQYFSFDDQDYCWYDDGWHGPGWYWCGYEWYEGSGWGGPYGWNGWGGGYYIRRHGRHGAGVWHAGPPGRGLGAGGGPAARGLPAGGAPTRRHFGAGGARARPGLNGGVPAYPGFEPGSNRRLLTFSKAFDYRLSAAPNKRSRENAGPAIPRSSQGTVDCSDAAGSTLLKLQGARRCPDERVSGMCSRRGDTK